MQKYNNKTQNEHVNHTQTPHPQNNSTLQPKPKTHQQDLDNVPELRI